MMENSADYDSFEGIQAYCSSIAGLHELDRERHIACYDRGERLKTWFIMNRFMLDPCGNFMRVSDEQGFQALQSLPVVASQDVFNKVVGEDAFVSFGFVWSSTLPPVEVVCPECGRGWHTLEVLFSGLKAARLLR